MPAEMADKMSFPAGTRRHLPNVQSASLEKLTTFAWSQQFESEGEGLLPQWQVRLLAAADKGLSLG